MAIQHPRSTDSSEENDMEDPAAEPIPASDPDRREIFARVRSLIEPA